MERRIKSFIELPFSERLQILHRLVLFGEPLSKNERELLADILAVLIDVEGGYQKSVDIGNDIVIRKERKAKIELVVTDDGCYGFNACGACGAHLPKGTSPKECPHCGAIFTGSTIHPGFGGSDF